jgi:formylglycine-generating enzyme required for sulfatase activity
MNNVIAVETWLVLAIAAGSVTCSTAPITSDVGVDARSADLPGFDLGSSDGADQGSSDGADLGAVDSNMAHQQRWGKVAKTTFAMGSPNGEACVVSSAETQHNVTLTHDFEIQTTEVTQDQYKALLGDSPSQHVSCGGDCPVERVNWDDAAFYCNKLSEQKGLASCYACYGSAGAVNCSYVSPYGGEKIYTCPGYRLPTEAEWELAYRAGTTTPFYTGFNDGTLCTSCSSPDPNLDPIGWYCANSGGHSHPVGQKKKNNLGLWDMPGNVAEWCHDWGQNLGSGAVTNPWGPATAQERVFRGGSFQDPAHNLRAADRDFAGQKSRKGHIGFRCVRSLN